MLKTGAIYTTSVEVHTRVIPATCTDKLFSRNGGDTKRIWGRQLTCPRHNQRQRKQLVTDQYFFIFLLYNICIK